MGFGRVATATVLGQPLNFGAAVRLEGDETLVPECVGAEVDSGDRRLPAAMVRVSIEPGPSAAERWIRVTTSTQIDEPVVAVQVTLGCNGGLTRRFVSFIDPPAIALAQTEAPSDGAGMPAQRLESTVAPIVAAVQSTGPAAAPAASEPVARSEAPRREAPAPRPRRERVAAAPADAPAPVVRPRPKPAPKPRVVAAAPADAGARLKLDAPALAVVAAASAPMVGAAPAEPAASAAAVVTDTALAEELKRLKTLEDDVRAVRDQTLAAQTAMVALQTRLKEAEESRYANPLVYGLATLSALLAIAVAGLWWRQSQSPARGASPWWSPVPEPVPAARRRTAPPRAGASGFGADVAAPAVKVETVPAVMDERPIPPTVTENVVPRRMAASMPPPTMAPPEPAGFPATAFPHTQAPDDKRRELAVEELIDLEQQAEFFIVLGQEDAAVDLLMGHLRSTGGASPLPYLKLLEIYRRRGDRDAYERIRSRFNRRFNAYAPDWEADLQHGRSLEDHPQLMARIQAQWKDPAKVMLMLDGALLQRDELAEPFDLPACRDLLFLYSVARDLAENEGKLSTIDLLLPLDDAQDNPLPRGVMSLDLDVSSPTSASGLQSGIHGLADGRPPRA